MAAPLIIDPREPFLLALGDNISFERNLPSYLPSAGWSLEYSIEGGAAGDVPITFNSTPDSTNTIHVVNVTTAVTATWVAGTYTLRGWALNAGTGERHELYYSQLTLTPNVGQTASTLTHAQRMITLLESQLEFLAAHPIEESDIQQTNIRRVRRLDLERQLATNKEIRQNEIDRDNVRNGRPSGQRLKPQAHIITSWPGNYPTWNFPH